MTRTYTSSFRSTIWRSVSSILYAHAQTHAWGLGGVTIMRCHRDSFLVICGGNEEDMTPLKKHVFKRLKTLNTHFPTLKEGRLNRLVH